MDPDLTCPPPYSDQLSVDSPSYHSNDPSANTRPPSYFSREHTLGSQHQQQQQPINDPLSNQYESDPISFHPASLRRMNSGRYSPDNVSLHSGNFSVNSSVQNDRVYSRSTELHEPLLDRSYRLPQIQILETHNSYVLLLNDESIANEIRKMKKYKPLFLIICTIIQILLLGFSFYANYREYGVLIQVSPFNPMIGPSTTTLIQIGAKYTPCILPTEYFNVSNCPLEYQEAFPPVYLLDPDGEMIACGDLERLCGMGGFRHGEPDQWWRYITPIFLHSGVLHLLFNLIFQIRTGFQLEREMGFLRMFFVYMSSGVYGFLLGSLFSVGMPSVGCSGALFGLVGLLLVDIIHHWKLIKNPWRELIKLLSVAIFSLLFGLLPFVDNFSHLGGFVMGIVTGFISLPAIPTSKSHKKRIRCFSVFAFIIYLGLFVIPLTWIYFYGVDKELCWWCKYLDCAPLPYLEDFCY